MGTGKVTARRGADGTIQYDTEPGPLNPDGAASGKRKAFYNQELEKGKASARAELYSSEEAAIRSKTSALSATVGGLTGTGAGYSNASSETRVPESNPGISDSDSQGDIDLSTSDTTARRKAGYRRDSGIRI